jgi:hypothetical protein
MILRSVIQTTDWGRLMELVWATELLVIGGRPYPGFPILLWDSMDGCAPANEFFRFFLLRGAIGSQKSWPSTSSMPAHSAGSTD